MSFFMSGLGMSPGPMALALSFFPDDDADSDSRWLSQVFGGAESSTAVVGPSFGPEVGDMFMSQQNGPAEFLVSQQPAMSPVPPGLSPHSFLDSPGVFTSSQVLFLFCFNFARNVRMIHPWVLDRLCNFDSRIHGRAASFVFYSFLKLKNLITCRYATSSCMLMNIVWNSCFLGVFLNLFLPLKFEIGSVGNTAATFLGSTHDPIWKHAFISSAAWFVSVEFSFAT